LKEDTDAIANTKAKNIDDKEKEDKAE